jgi:hypothetical protein
MGPSSRARPAEYPSAKAEGERSKVRLKRTVKWDSLQTSQIGKAGLFRRSPTLQG